MSKKNRFTTLMSYDELIRTTTDNFISNMIPSIDYSTLASMLTLETRAAVKNYNIANKLQKGEAYPIPLSLNADQTAKLLLKKERIVCINTSGDEKASDYKLAVMYQDCGPEEGTYSSNEKYFKCKIREIKPNITKAELDIVKDMIESKAPAVEVNHDEDLIAVNNGLFNFKTKELEPFSPEHVFLGKIKINYNPQATNVVLTNPDGTAWDVESWMKTLSDDPEVVDLLWEICSATVRPNVRWNKSIWLKARSGNNGKGTFCTLLRRLCGGNAVSLSLKQFKSQFGLSRLIGANAVIVDEVRVNDYVDDVENLKTAVTGDVLNIDRKHKESVLYQYNGVVVFCVNGVPRVHDKTGSFYRRLLIVPFDHCFTGAENPTIKGSHLSDTRVLEYVLYKVLNMNFYKLSEPAACTAELDAYKEFNDNVLQFMQEILPEAKWDLLPFSWLFACYKSWFRKNIPNGTIQGKNTFITEVIDNLPKFPEWYTKGRDVPVRPGFLMDKQEPLNNEYGLVSEWSGLYIDAPEREGSRKLKAVYRGLLRTNSKVDSYPGTDSYEDVKTGSCNEK